MCWHAFPACASVLLEYMNMLPSYVEVIDCEEVAVVVIVVL